MYYTIVVERTPNNYSAYVPQLPGCVTTGNTWEEIGRNITEAVELYLEELQAQGAAIPEPEDVVLEIVERFPKSLSAPSPPEEPNGRQCRQA